MVLVIKEMHKQSASQSTAAW